ncbi:hypothetical protein D9758_016329 [Tetrapyrgos nigripes]|uniref:MYND-type domain-containing protein n=1 Tax=Tetrapyrgos nigripes TaxID=182062 RepID=A0A8H5FFZ9_9AGAR|nr:hypothetical protein D9758_016329 [Tetrapyrgos nigripes]
MPDDTIVENLQSTLENTKSSEEKLAAVLAAIELSDEPRLRQMTGSGSDCTSTVEEEEKRRTLTRIHELAQQHGLSLDQVFSASRHRIRIVTHLEFLECANHDVTNSQQCLKKATKTCSQCRLVIYCSEACQLQHWKRHKLGELWTLFQDWRPRWLEEQRSPALIHDDQEAAQRDSGINRRLWGTMSAIDILNLEANEGLAASLSRNFALAFATSGDIRNVIRTVNAVPEGYEGTLDIVINDRDEMVQCRNLLLLVTLGMLPDVVARGQGLQLVRMERKVRFI